MLGAHEFWGPDSDLNAGAKPGKEPKERKTFPCEHCHGTGKFMGARVRQQKEHCFVCKGKGFFYTNKFQREKNRVKSSERKRDSRINNLVEFDAENPGLREFLALESVSNKFAASLSEQLQKKGTVSDKQLACAKRLQDGVGKTPEEKIDYAAAFDAAQPWVRPFLNEVAGSNDFAASLLEKLNRYHSLSVNQLNALLKMRAQKTERATVQPTLERLAKAFLDSSAHLKHPKLRLQSEDGLPIVLSRAGALSREPGTINMTDGGSYGSNKFYGRIMPDGRAFYRDAPESIVCTLVKFDQDPQAEMLVQGQRTGSCCLCGRGLTNKESLERGVGPICAGRWGF